MWGQPSGPHNLWSFPRGPASHTQVQLPKDARTPIPLLCSSDLLPEVPPGHPVPPSAAFTLSVLSPGPRARPGCRRGCSDIVPDLCAHCSLMGLTLHVCVWSPACRLRSRCVLLVASTCIALHGHLGISSGTEIAEKACGPHCPHAEAHPPPLSSAGRAPAGSPTLPSLPSGE